MTVVLEIELFRMISRRGAERAFWLGFEAAGWVSLLVCVIFARTLWWHARVVFEESLINREIGRPLDMGQFVLFVGGLHALCCLAIALLGGLISRLAFLRWGPEHPGSPRPPA
jgi:hypothetical protein